MKQDRVHKWIAASGIMSRRKAEEAIRQGRVALNGQVFTDLGRTLDPSIDRVSIDGEPVAGDVFSLARPVSVAGDNSNALALADLRDSRLFGLTADAQGRMQGGSTLTEAWTAILSRSGVQVQAAQSASQISQGVAEDAEARRASRSGVNLDEEAARLIQYQQSYQAAAKVLQVAQSVFDTLLQTADR